MSNTKHTAAPSVDELHSLREAVSAAIGYLGTLVKDDGSDDDHPSRTHHTDLCQSLDAIGWPISTQPCEACQGRGWIHGSLLGQLPAIIQRCDQCDSFADDAEAVAHVIALAKGEG